MRSSTLVMPGADQATRSASSRSIQERTVPSSVTTLPFASTVIRSASTSAFRLNASWILRLSSEGSTFGFTMTTLMTPLTPLLPLHRAPQSDPAVLDDELDPVIRNRQFRLQGRNRVSRNTRIGTLIDRRQPDLDIIRDRVDSRDPLRRGLGFKSVGVTMGKACQRNNAVFDRDRNIVGVKIGIPFQLVPDIAFDFTVGFHDWLLVCSKGIIRLG